MTEANQVQSAIDAAEHAAAAGDYMAAERHLSDAASQQEASLGPLHPDLANTLNNLGVVYETNDKPGDAERCYRRAYAIAIAALEPDHPFVATSEKNLRDFCEARGKPFELPKPLPAIAPVSGPAAVATPVAVAPPPEVRSPEPEVASRNAGTQPHSVAEGKSPRLGAVALAGVVVVLSLVTMRMWLGGNESGAVVQEPAVAPAVESSAERVAPPEPAPPATTGPTQEAPPPAPVRAAPKPAGTSARAAAASPPRRSATASPPGRATVVEASLCSALSTGSWRCSSVSDRVNPGQLFFYTRIKSPAATTVEHRWYLGNRLQRSVAIRVQPNERTGFRTYSRAAVKAGDWRVELRTRGGAVLHEERFVVR